MFEGPQSIDQDFLFAWLVYLGASLVFLLIWYLLTKPIPFRWVRVFLRLPAIAILLTPLHIPIHNMQSDQVYAPAVASFGIDLVAGHTAQAMNVLPYLATAVGISLIFGFLYLYCFPERKGKK